MEHHAFTGRWICDPRFAQLQPLNVFHKANRPPALDTPHPEELKNAHVLFSRRFSLAKAPGRYVLYFSADDYGKVYINGRPAGQGPRPGYITAYNYNAFDVTDCLADGDNEITVHAYYQGLINRVWVSGDLRMGVIADLAAPDGRVVLSTDESWQCAVMDNYTSRRVTGMGTQYLEDYDSRIPLPAPRPACVRRYADYVFRQAPAPAVTVYAAPPVSREALPGGGVFLDFGTEVTGALRLHAAGRAGDTVTVLCGEETEDSDVRVRHRMRCNCDYSETWTLAEGDNTLEQYDYKGYRYVTLLPGSPSVRIGEACTVVRHAPFDDAACTLRAEDPVLQAVFDLCKNGVKYGTQEVYVDCPTREKGQYAGDMTVTSGSQLWLTGDIRLLELGIRDQAHSARICPGLMAVMTSSFMQEIADYSLQFPLLLLRHYAFTGDKTFLASMLPVAEGMLAHFARFAREDGLLAGVDDKWNLVDWPANLRDHYDFTLEPRPGAGAHNVINAFYVGSVGNVEEIKDILGVPHGDDAARLAAAFNRAFFRPERGCYVDAEGSDHASLHANILAPFYGLVPAGYERPVGDFLVSKGLVCGVYMAYFYLRGLCRLGRYEDAYRTIVSTGEHSWYNMVRQGGTTCMEAWGKEQKCNASLCHPWASAPVTVLIEDLLGVRYDGTRGECHLPAAAGRVEMTVPTAAGPVTVTAGEVKSEK